jgi:glycosyltransferase involved in cell wall biosynthesis
VGRKIAIFDYKSVFNNPVGSCHLRMLTSLCRVHDFTVFAVEFENPCSERIGFVRIPAPTRPLALLFAAYHLLAPLYYQFYLLRHRMRFDLVQMVESNLRFGDVSYAQFCHRAFLRNHWKNTGGATLRHWLRGLDHLLHALLEPLVYRRVRRIVVPSRGLARELAEEYPYTEKKLHLLPNPVDMERMGSPVDFDRAGFRRELGVAADDVVLVFVALGHFERKGLPALLGALQQVAQPNLKLVVVGGQLGLIAEYRDKTDRLGLGDRVMFAGAARDVRPYFWAADAFAFPSYYEAFSLVSLEAAAAGLPLIATPINGVEEFLRDGENGILVDGTADGVSRGIARFLSLPKEARRAMGMRARHDVEQYATENFVEAWRKFYEAGLVS